MKLNRRNFMKGLAGITAGLCALSKAEEPKYEIGCDPAIKGSDKSVVYYDLIADLVEEMNNFDKKIPYDTKISFSIHCNYTGLAFLNDTRMLEKVGIYEGIEGVSISHHGYTHLLWIPYENWMRINTFHSSVIMNVMVRPDLTEDLGLIAQYSTKRNITNKLENTWTLVTTRCFNVNRNEEGRAIAGVRHYPECTEKLHNEMALRGCFNFSKEAMPAGTMVGYDDKRGALWVKPIKHKDFYKNGRIS